MNPAGVPDGVPHLTLDHVARRLAGHHAAALPDGELTGAVLVPFTAAPDPTLLFTGRADAVANFPREVSFPGGGREPGDATLLATALRETEEEVGIPRAAVRILGRLDDHHAYGTHAIRSFVGVLQPDASPRPDPAEVDRVFTVPLAALADAAIHELRTLPRDPRTGKAHTVHYFRIAGETIWGATGRLVADLLAITLGWRPPGPARTVDSWDAFRRDL